MRITKCTTPPLAFYDSIFGFFSSKGIFYASLTIDVCIVETIDFDLSMSHPYSRVWHEATNNMEIRACIHATYDKLFF